MIKLLDIFKWNGAWGMVRIIKAFKFSANGFIVAIKTETAFQQEVLFTLILLPFSFFVAHSLFHWVALVCSVLFLLYAEIVNSALEAIADTVTLDHHPLIGKAKDYGSASVFLAILVLMLVWGEAFFTFVF